VKFLLKMNMEKLLRFSPLVKVLKTKHLYKHVYSKVINTLVAYLNNYFNALQN